MHLQDPDVAVGKWVGRGSVIGFAGATGIRVTGVHLHFELRHNGVPIDPAPFLPKLTDASAPAPARKGPR
jgi:murein DD-endopeptidase MepM/ murein hydrolase activator NlpD